MLSLGGILGVASLIPVAIIFALTGREIGVALSRSPYNVYIEKVAHVFVFFARWCKIVSSA
jgi:hypothetical protein